MNFINAANISRTIFLGMLLHWCTFIACAQFTESLSAEPVLRYIDLPPGAQLNQITGVKTDNRGVIYLSTKQDLWSFNGKSWNKVASYPGLIIETGAGNEIFACSENQIFQLSADSSLNYYLKTIEIPGEALTGQGKINQILSSGAKVFILISGKVYSLDSEGLRREIEFTEGITGLWNVNNQILALSFSNLLTEDGSILLKSPFKLNNTTSLFAHQKGLLFCNQETKEFNIYDKASGRFYKPEYPGVTNILASLTLREKYQYYLIESSGKIMLTDFNGTALSLEGLESAVKNSRLVNMIETAEGNILLAFETLLVLIQDPIRYQRIPVSSETIFAAGLVSGTLYTSGPEGLLLSDRFRTSKIVDRSFRYSASTGEKLYFLSDTALVRISSDQTFNIFPSGGQALYPDPVSKSILIKKPMGIYLMSDTSGMGSSPIEIQLPVGISHLMYHNNILWYVSESGLTQVHIASGKSDTYPIQDLQKIQDLVLLCSYRDELLWITKNKAFYFRQGRFEPIARLNTFLNGGIYSTGASSGNVLLLVYRHPYFGAQAVVLKNDSVSIVSLKRFGLKSEQMFNLKLVNDSLALLNNTTELFLLNLEVVEPENNFSPVITGIFSQADTLMFDSDYHFLRPMIREKLKKIKASDLPLRFEVYPTGFQQGSISLQYQISGKGDVWSDWFQGNTLEIKDPGTGDHLIKIRLKNEDNLVSDTVKVGFSVLPPPFLSWYAALLYLIAAAFITFILFKTYRLRKHKAVVHKQDTYPSTEYRQKEEIAEEKLPVRKEDGERQSKWDKYEMTTVLFSDIQGFTKIAEVMNPELLIDELDKFFFHFDSVVEKYNIEKIKTIGDAYMAAGGIPRKNSTNPVEVVLAALEMQQYMKELKTTKTEIWDLRIGIHTGPVIAGVVGHKKRTYDIWGDTVNTASRMESSGEAGKVNISGITYSLVKEYFICEYRGKLPVKYKGNIDMYFVKGLRPELSVNLGTLPNRRFFLKLQLQRLNDLEEFIMDLLKEKLPENAFFHSLEYSRHVYNHSSLLCLAENLDMEETLLVRTSALLLFTGVIHTFSSPEKKSAEMAFEILPEYQYSPKQIQNITNLILSARVPEEANNHLEMLISDLKMEYLGRIDYIELQKLFFRELSQSGHRISQKEWIEQQLILLQRYEFKTQAGKRLREVNPEEQIRRLKEENR